MDEKINEWKKAREELSTKMNNMANQPNGRGCMPTLAQIDQDWVFNYNNYVSVYNNLGYGSGDWSGAIGTAETRMLDVLERIRLAPTYCY
jgi:hypothetical protein